jgi:hypothetical protein
MLLMAGLVVAAEVTLVKYDPEKKEVTVKEGDVEKTYKLTDKTKVFVIRDGKAEDATVLLRRYGNEYARCRTGGLPMGTPYRRASIIYSNG